MSSISFINCLLFALALSLFFLITHFYFRQIVTHGFATDEAGMKMSKSVGNVIEPEFVINGGKVGIYVMIS